MAKGQGRMTTTKEIILCGFTGNLGEEIQIIKFKHEVWLGLSHKFYNVDKEWNAKLFIEHRITTGQTS